MGRREQVRENVRNSAKTAAKRVSDLSSAFPEFCHSFHNAIHNAFRARRSHAVSRPDLAGLESLQPEKPAPLTAWPAIPPRALDRGSTCNHRSRTPSRQIRTPRYRFEELELAACRRAFESANTVKALHGFAVSSRGWGKGKA